MATYSLNKSSTRFTYWADGSNKGLLGQTNTYWHSGAARQVAYTSYNHNYYTTFMKFGNASDIAAMNETHYPTSIKITCARTNNQGLWSLVRTARFGCLPEASANGRSGLTQYNDVSIRPYADGLTTYTITTNLSEAQTYVNILADGGYFSLGCNKKPTSDTSPLNITNYMGLYYNDMELTIEWATRATSTTAPTAVTITPTVAKAGSSITISWSGAKAGTNNSISGYRIFWRDGAAPTLSTYTGYKDVAVVSSTTVNTGAEGVTRYFKIQTKGAYGAGYWSPISSASDTILGNVPPTITNVSPATNTVFVSTTTTFKFSSLASTPNTGSSTMSYYYATSAGGTKTLCTTNTAITLPTGTTTFYLWAYDGIDYSKTYITRAYTKNVAPTITSFTATCPELGCQDPPSSGYIYATRITSAKAVSNKTGTYQYEYLIGSTWRSLTSSTAASLANISLTSLTGVAPGIKIEQLRVRVHDNYEYSAYYTINLKVHIVANPTAIGNVVNQLGSSNVTNTNPNHFYQNIRIYFRGDEGISNIGYSINSGTEVLTSAFSRGNGSTQGYVNLSLGSVATTKGASYTIKITLYRDSIKVTLPTTTLTRTRTNLPTFTNISSLTTSLGTNGLRPHLLVNSAENFTISFYNIFGSSTPAYVNDFDMSTTLYNNLTVNVGYNGTYKPINYYSNYSLTSDTITLSFPKNIFNTTLVNQLGITNLYGNYPISIQLGLKNAFGESTTKAFSNVFTLYFTENFPMTSSDLNLNLNNTAWSNGKLLRKSDIINCTLVFNSYNYVKTTIQPQVARMNSATTPAEANWVNYGNSINLTPPTTQKVGVEWSEVLTPNITVGEIAESKYIYFRTKITNTLNSEAKIAYPLYGISVRHNSASGFGISEVHFDRDPDNPDNKGEISLIYNSTNSGLHVRTGSLANVSCTAELQFSLSSDFSTVIPGLTTLWKTLTVYGDITTNFTGIDKATSIVPNSLPNTGWNFYYVRIKLVTTDNTELGTKTRTTYTTPTLIYNTSPTVSYRANQIGINYDINNDHTDAVLVINVGPGAGENGRHIIKLMGGGWEGRINIITGEIDGFTIREGSWD